MVLMSWQLEVEMSRKRTGKAQPLRRTHRYVECSFNSESYSRRCVMTMLALDPSCSRACRFHEWWGRIKPWSSCLRRTLVLLFFASFLHWFCCFRGCAIRLVVGKGKWFFTTSLCLLDLGLLVEQIDTLPMLVSEGNQRRPKFLFYWWWGNSSTNFISYLTINRGAFEVVILLNFFVILINWMQNIIFNYACVFIFLLFFKECKNLLELYMVYFGCMNWNSKY